MRKSMAALHSFWPLSPKIGNVSWVILDYRSVPFHEKMQCMPCKLLVADAQSWEGGRGRLVLLASPNCRTSQKRSPTLPHPWEVDWLLVWSLATPLVYNVSRQVDTAVLLGIGLILIENGEGSMWYGYDRADTVFELWHSVMIFCSMLWNWFHLDWTWVRSTYCEVNEWCHYFWYFNGV